MGNIFLKGSYCGFVLFVDETNESIKILGYNRLMPFIEGLVEETFVFVNRTDGRRLWDRKFYRHRLDEFNYFIDEISFDKTMMRTNK